MGDDLRTEGKATGPDYQKFIPYDIQQIDVPTGELAARLGSAVRYYRTGEVWFYDSFESDQLHWNKEEIAGRGYIVVQDYEAEHKGNSVKLKTGATSDDLSGISHSFQPPKAQRIGFEIAVRLPDDYYLLEVKLHHWDGGSRYIYGIHYDRHNTELSYLNSGGTYTVIDDSLCLCSEKHMWHSLKLVIDVEDNKYHKLYVNETTYDLAGITPQATSAPNIWALYAEIILYTKEDAAKTYYIDRVVLTRKEP